MPNNTARTWSLRISGFILFSILFAIAYTQSPLFTSNQNQYFLHGLADTGYGYLNQDWLANTLDPTPLFRKIVSASYSLFHNGVIYYLFYGLLLGIYLFSLIGIVSTRYDIKRTKVTYISFIALLFLVNSAAIRFFFSRTLGVNWTYILEDGVADQRLLGTVFQPSTFGVLLLLSIYLFLRNRPYFAVLSATLAASLHPTYLLSAGVLTAAYMLITYKEQRNTGKTLLIGGIALITVAPILFYVYSNFVYTPADTAAQAQEILVNFRIPHHALISWWFDATAVVKILFIIAALFQLKNGRIFTIMALLFGTGVTLTIVQYLTQNNALALIFPWRISTLLLPLSISLILGALVVTSADRFPAAIGRYQNWLIGVSILVISITVIIGLVRLTIDFDRKSQENERAVMAYAAANAEPDQVYLTPIKMQDFRLESGVPAFIDFKSIPYRDEDVLEWYRRVQSADRFYKQNDCTILEQIASEGAVTHVILEAEQFAQVCPSLHSLFQDEHYGIYLYSQ